MAHPRRSFSIPLFGKVLAVLYQESRSQQSASVLSEIATAYTAFCTTHLTEQGFRLIPRFALTDDEIKNAYNSATNKNTVRVTRIQMSKLPNIVLNSMHSIEHDATIMNPFGQLPWTDPRHIEARVQRVILDGSTPGEHAAFEEALRVYFTTPLVDAIYKTVPAQEFSKRLATVVSDLFYLAFVHAIEGRNAKAIHLLPLIQMCVKGALPIGDQQDGDKLFCCDILFQ